MQDNTRDIVLYDDSHHKCIMFSFDDEEHEESFLSLNQYLIIQNDSAILIDPGSESIFDEMYDRVSEYIDIENIKYVFFSHQDPDVAGSIAQWSSATQAKIITPSIWVRFMSHYGLVDVTRILAMQDDGGRITFSNDYLEFVPAHFLHSPGNFSLYDSRSKILFSGDIGAAVMPPQNAYKKVTNFSEHQRFLEAFHKRYLASNAAIQLWLKHLKSKEINIIAPQHGAIFEEEQVEAFLTWLETLECGTDIL